MQTSSSGRALPPRIGRLVLCGNPGSIGGVFSPRIRLKRRVYVYANQLIGARAAAADRKRIRTIGPALAKGLSAVAERRSRTDKLDRS